MPSMFVPETQGVARDGSDDEMLIDEDPATELPGTPVARTGSDCFGARVRLLDVVYVARDGAL